MPVCVALLRCRGHPNVQLYHESTLELEKEARLTIRGDCIACIGCRDGGEAECASRRGLAKLYIAAFNSFYAASGKVGVVAIDGLAPGVKPGRSIVRKSCYAQDSLVLRASVSARDLPASIKSLLQSSFTRCTALYIVFTPASINVDSIYELSGCIVENTPGSSNG